MQSLGTRRGSSLLASLAFVCLMCQAFGFAHLALVVHRVCALHGEMVHGAVEPSAARRAGMDPLLQHHADHDQPHSHDHCALASTSRPALRVSPLSLGKTPALFERAPGRLAEPAGGARLILFVAPKSSPPV